MSAVIDVGEMTDILIALEREQKLPIGAARQVSAAIETIDHQVRVLGHLVAEALEVNFHWWSSGFDIGGYCGVFSPRHHDQPIPEVFLEYDPDCDWEVVLGTEIKPYPPDQSPGVVMEDGP